MEKPMHATGFESPRYRTPEALWLEFCSIHENEKDQRVSTAIATLTCIQLPQEAQGIKCFGHPATELLRGQRPEVCGRLAIQRFVPQCCGWLSVVGGRRVASFVGHFDLPIAGSLQVECHAWTWRIRTISNVSMSQCPEPGIRNSCSTVNIERTNRLQN